MGLSRTAFLNLMIVATAAARYDQGVGRHSPSELVTPMIEFLCPNGHRIRCQAIQAGKAAKCPRCGVKFRVPDATELNTPHVGESDPSVVRLEFTDSGVGGRKTAGAVTKQPQFEFLCPNGHRLHGPASLQGRPGECPDCGSRFRIPSYEDIAAEEETEEEIHLGRVNGREGSGIRGPAATPQSRPHVSRHDSAEEPMTTTPISPAMAGEAIAALLARLWNIRPKGATVELRLRSGETFTPDQFLAKASRESRQAVFATTEADATVTLVVVAWDAVERVTIRGLKEVPEELAD
jgi:hypothetical protein